jgi:putative hemolysin
LDGDSYPPPLSFLVILSESYFNQLSTDIVIVNFVILFLILCSGLMSASEVAYFSLTKPELENLKESEEKTENNVARLMEKPRYLLSTILITNNLVNIGVIILSNFVTTRMLNFIDMQIAGFLVPGYALEFTFNVVILTVVLVLFGEATPKVYATHNKFTIAKLTAGLFMVLMKLYRPLNWMLIGSTQMLERRLKKHNTEIDIEEINMAIEMTVENENKESKEDAKLLKGVVQLGNITVKQVMRPRVDVIALDASLKFDELVEKVKEYGYSRMPVFEDSLDNIKGVLYIKDLLQHLNQNNEFGWQTLIREPLFVPETKRIDDLLREIQESRKHMAIVVDEYGGTNGILTLEDIVEEVVGDIKDEFDEAEPESTILKIADGIFVASGKNTIDELCAALELAEDFFEEVKGEAETIGGLVLEILGRIPKAMEQVEFQTIKFTVLKIANNRIEDVRIELQ